MPNETHQFPELLLLWLLFSLDGPLPSVMQEVDLPIINNTRCEGMYRDAGYVEHIPEIFICAGYAAGGKDSCEVKKYKLGKDNYILFISNIGW